MNIESLFRGKLEAVQEEFGRDIMAVQTQIDMALDALKKAREEIDEDPDMDWQRKAKYDKTIESSSKILTDCIKVKEKILQDRSNFVQSQERWEAEEAVKVCLSAFIKVTSGYVTGKNKKKWEKSMDELIGKDISELKDI